MGDSAVRADKGCESEAVNAGPANTSGERQFYHAGIGNNEVLNVIQRETGSVGSGGS